MKPLLSAGVIAMAVAGISAYAITAVISEANLRMGTVAKNPVEAIQKGLTALKTDRRMIDGALVLASSWQPGGEEPAHPSSDQPSASVAWPVALLGADDENAAKAAHLAHTASPKPPAKPPAENPELQKDRIR